MKIFAQIVLVISILSVALGCFLLVSPHPSDNEIGARFLNSGLLSLFPCCIIILLADIRTAVTRRDGV
jgi:hypothetical protein